MRLEPIDLDFEAVIFDFDGTLVDSMWIWKDIDIEYLERFGIPFRESLQRDIEGFNIRETAAYFHDVLGVPRTAEEMRDDWVEMSLAKYRHEIHPKPYASEFLKFLKKHDILVGIASSNDPDNIAACGESNDILRYIDLVLTTNDVPRGKPHPDVYLEASRRLGIPPESILVFEDLSAGIMAAKNAGMTVTAVYDEFSDVFKEEKIRLADYYIHDYSELLPGTKVR